MKYSVTAPSVVNGKLTTPAVMPVPAVQAGSAYSSGMTYGGNRFVTPINYSALNQDDVNKVQAGLSRSSDGPSSWISRRMWQDKTNPWRTRTDGSKTAPQPQLTHPVTVDRAFRRSTTQQIPLRGVRSPWSVGSGIISQPQTIPNWPSLNRR